LVQYATVEQLQAYSSISFGNSSTDDFTLQEASEILETASREVERLCGTKFTPTIVNEWEFYGRSRTGEARYLHLHNFPLVSTSTITIQLADGEAANPVYTSVPLDGFLFDGDKRVKLLEQYSVPIGVNTVRVKDYTYGVLDKYWEVVRLTCIAATLDLARSPKGKNAIMGRAEYTVQSAGQISDPATIFRRYILDLEEALEKQLEKVGRYQSYSDSE